MIPSECTGCGDTPCSCENPIWNYRLRSHKTGEESWNWGTGTVGVTRSTALLGLSDSLCGYDRGPVQKLNEASHPFEPRIQPPVAGSESKFLLFDELLSEMYAATPAKSPLPPAIRTEVELAELLFFTDDTVREAIAAADDRGGGILSFEREEPYYVSEYEMFKRAWAKDEGGRATWAKERAAWVFAVVRYRAEKSR